MRVVFLLAVLVVAVWAGELEGSVTIASTPREFAKSQAKVTPGYCEPNRETPPPLTNELEGVVVWLEGEGLRATPRTSKEPGNLVRMKGNQYTPHVLALPLGSKVYFKNEDSFIHRVYSLSEAGRFDFKGFKGERSEELLKLGVIEIFDALHPAMCCYVVVVPNDFFASCDGKGQFSLAGIPAGSYTLKVWHPRLPEQSLPVIIPAKGRVSQAVKL